MDSKKRKSSNNSKIDKKRKFWIFVKPMNREEDLPIIEECGWYGKSGIVKSTKDAIEFTENEDGHGSTGDWIKLIGENHPDWDLSYRYTDEKPFDPLDTKTKRRNAKK